MMGGDPSHEPYVPSRFVMLAPLYRVLAAIERAHGTALYPDEFRVQATAATIIPATDTTARWVRKIAASLREELGEDVVIELKAHDPQCVDCGCCEALACDGGCTWVEPSAEKLCSECDHKRNACPHCGSHPNDACDMDCPVYTEDCDGNHKPGEPCE